ncbi:MAG TPA: hypothetical protein VFJ58_25725 [Armatimonadota bacterium]|nr:hypothetical protein [Armatimonadota bacterium]
MIRPLIRSLKTAALLVILAAASPPAHAAHWDGPTYQADGAVTGTFYDPYASPTTQPINQTWVDNYGTLYSESYEGMINSPGGPTIAQTAGTIQITFTWVADYGDPSPLPKPTEQESHVYILLSGSAFAEGNNGIAADDGLGDAAVNSDSQPPEATSSGSHLIQADGSSGVINLSYSLSASAGAVYTSAYPSACRVDVGLTAALDPRSVIISSSVDPTYRRDTSSGTPARVVNSRAPDGTLNGDTLIPLDDVVSEITYSAPTTGTWGDNSSFNWYASLYQSAYDGAFSPGSVPPFVLDYFPEAPYANPSFYWKHPDHVFIDLIDSNYGASAHNNYYMNFHEPYEDWVETSTVVHPIPITQSMDDWTFLQPAENPNADPMQVSVSSGESHTESVSATFGIEASLGVEDAAIKANVGKTVGDSVTETFQTTFTFTIPAHTIYYIYWAPSWETDSGTCSVWGINGYQGDGSWTCSFPTGPLSAVIVYHSTDP